MANDTTEAAERVGDAFEPRLPPLVEEGLNEEAPRVGEHRYKEEDDDLPATGTRRLEAPVGSFAVVRRSISNLA